jgi:hypothetical protein
MKASCRAQLSQARRRSREDGNYDPPTTPSPGIGLGAQEAGRWIAIAIELVAHKPTEAPEALTDALGRRLVVCVFVDAARSHGARE